MTWIPKFLLLSLFWERVWVCTWLLWNSFYRSGWPWAHRDQSVSLWILKSFKYRKPWSTNTSNEQRGWDCSHLCTPQKEHSKIALFFFSFSKIALINRKVPMGKSHVPESKVSVTAKGRSHWCLRVIMNVSLKRVILKIYKFYFKNDLL